MHKVARGLSYSGSEEEGVTDYPIFHFYLQKSFDALTHLDLFNNDICNLEDYRSKVFKLLPTLKYLDDADEQENEEEEAEDSEGERNGTLSDEDDEQGEI